MYAGLTLTQTWTTANQLDTKVELEDNVTKGLKAEILTNYLPAKSTYGGKLNLYYKQPNVNTRLFTDLFKGPIATFDASVGHEGFVVGAEGGYDVGKAAITRYALAAGYSQPTYAAAITATNNLSIFSASYYHKVNTEVEAGAKATWDSNAGSNVGLEVATKYKLDPTSFAKVRRFTIRSRFLTNRQHRPRSTIRVLLLSLTTSSSAPVSLSVSVHPSIPKTSRKLLTRLVLPSHSRAKEHTEPLFGTRKFEYEKRCTADL